MFIAYNLVKTLMSGTSDLYEVHCNKKTTILQERLLLFTSLYELNSLHLLTPVNNLLL